MLWLIMQRLYLDTQTKLCLCFDVVYRSRKTYKFVCIARHTSHYARPYRWCPHTVLWMRQLHSVVKLKQKHTKWWEKERQEQQLLVQSIKIMLISWFAHTNQETIRINLYIKEIRIVINCSFIFLFANELMIRTQRSLCRRHCRCFCCFSVLCNLFCRQQINRNKRYRICSAPPAKWQRALQVRHTLQTDGV